MADTYTVKAFENRETLEEALYITMRETLGADFPRTAQTAWRHAFRHISDRMMQHAGNG